MQSQTLSDRRIDEIREHLIKEHGVDPLPKDALIRRIEYGNGVITVDGTPSYVFLEDTIIPLLSVLLREDNFLDSIVVDMGAVKPVVSGADIMHPGIVDIDGGIRAGDIVSVIDEDNRKPLAVVRAKTDSDTMKSEETGVGATSLHYVGDEVWDEFCG